VDGKRIFTNPNARLQAVGPPIPAVAAASLGGLEQLAGLACQSVGGRRFGRVRGVLFAPRQLPLQIRDLLLGVRDLLLFLGDLLRLLRELSPQMLHFAAQTFVLAAQCLADRPQ
jgi:hypothetical protein